MRKDKKNIIQITLTTREIEILSFIIREEGQRNIPAAIHDCITNYYKFQYFNKQYMRNRKGDGIEKAPVENLTLEQNCEKFGGKVVTKEGIEKCDLILPGSRSIYSIPLNDLEQIKAISKQFKIT